MPIPVLTTPRLRLRPLQETDEEAIFAIRSSEEVNRYIYRSAPANTGEAAAFIRKITESVNTGNSYYWAICLKEDPRLSGTICIWNLSPDRKKAEIGYELFPDRQGKGYMNEALKAVIDFAFHSAGMETLEAYTHKDNLASSRLLLHNGFRQQTGQVDPEDENNVIYQLQQTQPA